MSTRGEKFALVAGLLGGVCAALIPSLVAARLTETLDAFGAELPLLTRAFLQYHSLLWLLPVAVLLIWLAWPQSRRRALTACLVGIVGAAVVVPLGVVALYLPVLKLSAVV